VAAMPPGIGQIELEVLKVLWEHGPSTVRDVHAILQRTEDRAYNTVLTHLQRLETKGYVASDKSGVANVYRAVVSRDRMLKQRLKDLANQLCEGTSTPLVLALVEGSRFTPEEIEQFRKLLDELDTEFSRRPRGGAGKRRPEGGG
jgi:predicted transcriptional regulator